ncbi:glycosyltransferase [Paenarthrobacter sp. Z7-10]|uniref:glycosyltransferase family 2 protein n=1 Tax=Paenarthrobacter sp. Z7-10 TaxID=2787635 RepID=UPI0022A9A79C|nr:glycosyltransferase [Paenarthrobacter sp. Z7-10]MCZ2403070.1 glycosyltransferase [Paenarthrobacter sp. Z7-10]
MSAATLDGSTKDLGKGERPAVCVIVPVYNAMPYLDQLLESLVEQELEAEKFEVILVNDGSTDGGPAVLDWYASTHLNFRVVHQENHGWPGQPRNLALDMTSAEFVFFADADDVLAPTALRKMLDFAQLHESDVLIPSMAGTHGRLVPPWLYRKDDIDAELPKVFKTLAPQKMYRRSLLADHGIRFPEEKVRLEDGIFNAHAYLRARRVSILGGESLYFLRARDDGRNISSGGLEPAGYTSSVATICRIVRENGLNPAIADSVILGLYRRKCLKIYTPGRFERYGSERQEAWLAAHAKFIKEFIPLDLEKNLAEPYRSRSALVRIQDTEGLLNLGRREEDPFIDAEFWGGSCNGAEGYDLLFQASITGRVTMPEMVCELRNRDGDGFVAFSLTRDHRITGSYGKAGLFRGHLPRELVRSLGEGVHDIFLSTYVARKYLAKRLSNPSHGVLPSDYEGVKFYSTAHNNLSVSVQH